MGSVQWSLFIAIVAFVHHAHAASTVGTYLKTALRCMSAWLLYFQKFVPREPTDEEATVKNQKQ
jgi:hypothetical protein